MMKKNKFIISSYVNFPYLWRTETLEGKGSLKSMSRKFSRIPSKMPVSDPSWIKIKLFLKAHENLCGAIVIVLLLFFFSKAATLVIY